jgi:ATP/ADP translocase
MAKKVQRKTSKQSKKSSVSPFNIYWNKKNYFLLITGFVVMILGYWIMSTGNWNSTGALILSPIVLTITYVIIFPLSIFSKQKNEQEKSEIVSK